MMATVTAIARETPLTRAGAGDEAAFADLVREHESMVFGIALHSLRNREAAEELAQEVFFQLYRNLATIESPDHLVHWLRRVTVNRCIDSSRRRRIQPVPLDSVVLAEAPANDDPLARRILLRLIGSLPVRQRLVIILRYQEELDLDEIASTLSIPRNTVKSHLHRGIESLRKGLARAAGGEGVRA